MSRVIINTDGVSEYVAVRLVANIMADGLVSNNNTQYCYISKFSNDVTVYADKTRTGTFTFNVFRQIEVME